MKIRTLALAAALTLTGVASASAEWTTVRIGTEGAYPPFNFVDTDGQLRGFDLDIAMALCEQMQVTCEIVAQDWDGIIPGLLADRYDAIIASMSITPERLEQVNFTDKYYQTPARFIARTGSGVTDTSPAAMAGKVIGAQSSTVSATYLEDVYSASEIRLYPTQDEANLDLASGRVDFVFADSIVLYEWLEKTDEGSCCEFVGSAYADEQYFGTGVGIAVRKEDDDLRILFNEALAAIIANGTYDRINAEYFPFSIY